MADDVEIGLRLQLLREEAGLTQPEMAAAADVHPLVYQTWEKGRTRLPARPLGALARILGLPVQALAQELGIGYPDDPLESAGAVHAERWRGTAAEHRRRRIEERLRAQHRARDRKRHENGAAGVSGDSRRDDTRSVRWGRRRGDRQPRT